MRELSLREELIAMRDEDQKMRTRQREELDFWDDEVDTRHLEKMKKIISKYGWPTVALVGRTASYAAWLLVQHADRDVWFQEHCLELMKAMPPGSVEKANIAQLEDRVRVNKKLPQVYGTQFEEKDDDMVPRPIEDPEHVEERRHKMGLGTMEEAIKDMRSKYR